MSKRKKSGHYDPERETCEPVPMNPDGVLIRAAGAPVSGLSGTAGGIQRVVVNHPLRRSTAAMKPCPYGLE